MHEALELCKADDAVSIAVRHCHERGHVILLQSQLRQQPLQVI